MAIALAVLKWRHNLPGQSFIICTDQKSLNYLMEQGEVVPEFQCCVQRIMGFDFTI